MYEQTTEAAVLSLIIPVYGNESGIDCLLDAVTDLHSALKGDFEAVFVVDGSPDSSYLQLNTKLPNCIFSSRLLLLSRNFGSFAAIRAGLEAGVGETFAVMAADLQEPPELIMRMQKALSEQDYDIVVGQRVSRADTWISSLLSKIFWGLYRRLMMPDMPPGGVDIFACSASFRDDLVKFSEKNSSLIAQVFWLGRRRACIPYSRQRRQHGVSAWTMRKKMRYFSDSIFSFTDLPIRALIILGSIVTGFSGCLGVFILLARLSGWIVVSGYSMIMLSIIFFGSANLWAIGLVGGYAWRAYENTKHRPLHIVMRQHYFSSQVEQKKAQASG